MLAALLKLFIYLLTNYLIPLDFSRISNKQVIQSSYLYNLVVLRIKNKYFIWRILSNFEWPKFFKVLCLTFQKHLKREDDADEILLFDLIEQMLKYDPIDRICMSEAVEHSFFKKLKTPEVEHEQNGSSNITWLELHFNVNESWFDDRSNVVNDVWMRFEIVPGMWSWIGCDIMDVIMDVISWMWYLGCDIMDVMDEILDGSNKCDEQCQTLVLLRDGLWVYFAHAGQGEMVWATISGDSKPGCDLDICNHRWKCWGSYLYLGMRILPRSCPREKSDSWF